MFTGKHLNWPLQTFFYRTPTVFWIFYASGFSQQQILFLADSGIYYWRSCRFCSELPRKQESNVRSSNWNSAVKKSVFRNFASFTGKQLCWSLFLIELQAFRPAVLLKRDSNTDVFLWNLQIFKEHLIWSLRNPASETCFFTGTALFNNLYFWLKLIHIL